MRTHWLNVANGLLKDKGSGDALPLEHLRFFCGDDVHIVSTVTN